VFYGQYFLLKYHLKKLFRLLLNLDEDWIHHQNVEVPGKPIQLIIEKENGQLELVPEALSIINGILTDIVYSSISTNQDYNKKKNVRVSNIFNRF
jgi:hypothetical protein